MLKTPNGNTIESLDRVMLLAMWARQLQSESKASGLSQKKIISAGMGKPSFPINYHAAKVGLSYWESIYSKAKQAKSLLQQHNDAGAILNEKIAEIGAVIDYGDPQGELSAREKMAQALRQWYGEQVNIQSEHILFTVGGAGALHNIFSVLNRQDPKNLIVTPFPHYSLYVGPHRANHLHPIDVMSLSGYCLTAAALAKSLEEAHSLAQTQETSVSALLLCDPNNPLGTVIPPDELLNIAEVLRLYPKLYIILDEAYAEMQLNGEKYCSLLSLAPDLKQRIILLRSATKALSAAGERMGILVAFDSALMTQFIQENINSCGHAPISSQIIFSEAMLQLTNHELHELISFYKPQVDYVVKRLKKIGAAMPDPHYTIQGTFYVMADLSALFGLPMSAGMERVFGEIGRIETDEHLIYYLLFNEGIMVAPLSYFGISPRLGYVRITCSGGELELKELLDRLEDCLLKARSLKEAPLKADECLEIHV